MNIPASHDEHGCEECRYVKDYTGRVSMNIPAFYDEHGCEECRNVKDYTGRVSGGESGIALPHVLG